MRTFVCLIFCLLLLCLPTQAFAELGNFTVAPPKIENVQIGPGQSITGTLQLFLNEEGQQFEISVGSVSQDTNGSFLLTPQSDDPRDASSWLSVQPKKFTSGPGNVEPITWTLKVPKGAEPGDHLATIFITQIGGAPTTGGARINARVAVRMEITVAGKIKFNPVVKQISVPRITSEKNVPVSVSIKNEGNVRIDLNNSDSRIEVIQSGDTKARYRLDGVLFPGAEKLYKFDWQDAPTWGKAQAKVTLDFDDKEKGQITEEQTFWLAPWQLMLAVLGGLIGLACILWAALRNRKKEPELPADEELDGEPESPHEL